MKRVVIPAEFLHLLGDMYEGVDFVDADGKVIGNFCPYVDYAKLGITDLVEDDSKFIDNAEIPPGSRRFRDVINELTGQS